MASSQMKKDNKESERAEVTYNKFLAVNVSTRDTVLAKNYAWAKDKQDLYIKVELVKDLGEQWEVLDIFGNTLKKSKKEIFDFNPPNNDGIEDLGDLYHLNDATVLHNLRLRYMDNRIHTYSGLFLVIINPYKRMPIYTPSLVKMYRNKRRQDIAPHIFSVADKSFRDMVDGRQNQSILITGESGAGKTENTKKVIVYMTNVAGSATGGERNLEDQILQANPILESFGNAKTLRNDNSSRFGKFIQMQFDKANTICGANIEHYLLELSRVVAQNAGERNFHVFYQLFAGAPSDLKEKLKLTRPQNYAYINKSGCYSVEEMDDQAEFKALVEAMDIMTITKEQQSHVFELVAAVLHLGNIPFKQDRQEKSSVSDAEEIGIASEILGVVPEDLEKAMTKMNIVAGGSKIQKDRNQDQAMFARDALVKILYDKLFAFLVSRINTTIDHQENMKQFIGVLDIAGFEIFEENSLEQICINFTNEKLQQFFNNHMFKLEQEEYAREKIVWEQEDFGMDLQGTIDMLEQPGGILSILDEECIFPKATDTSFLEKCHAAFDGKSEFYEKPRIGYQEKFIVKHYAGAVDYNVAHWLSKNMNPLTDDITVLLKESHNKFIQSLYQNVASVNVERSPGEKSKKKVITVVSQHKAQLTSLMNTLRSTQPHFVRCIKPNTNKAPLDFDNPLILHQLQCNGVIEGIRIARKGYPNRMPHGEFKKRFAMLCPEKLPLEVRDACAAILDYLKFDKAWWQIGRTKCFFKAGKLAELDKMRDAQLSVSAVRIQACGRGFVVRNATARAKKEELGAALLQKNMKIHLDDIRNPWFKLYVKLRPLLKPNRAEEEALARKKEIEDLRKERVALLEAKDKMDAQFKLLNDELFQTSQRADESDGMCKQLQREMNGLRADLEEARRAGDEASTQRAELEFRLSELNSRIAKLDAEVIDGGDKRAALQKEKQELAARLDAETDAKAAAEQQGERLQKQLDELMDRLDEEKRARAKLEQDKRGLEADISHLQDELNAENAKKAALEQQLADAKSDNEDLAQQKEETEKAKKKAEAEAKSLQAKLDATGRDLEDASATEADLRAKISALQDENEAAASASKKELLALKAKAADDLSAQREESSAAAKKAKKANQKKLADLQEELDAMEAANAALEDERAALEQKIKSVSEGAASAAAAAADNEKIAAMKAEISKLEEQLEEQKAKTAAVERERDALKSEVQELSEEVEATENKYKQKLEKAERDTLRAQQKFESEQSAHATLQEANKKLHEDHKRLQEESAADLAKADAAVQATKALESELAKAREETKTLRDSMAEKAKAASKNAERDLADTNAELEAERIARDAAEDELAELRAQNQELLQTVDKKSAEAYRSSRKAQSLENELAELKVTYERERTQWREDMDRLREQKNAEIKELDATVEACRAAEQKASRQNRSLERSLAAATNRLRFLPTSTRKSGRDRDVAEEDATAPKAAPAAAPTPAAVEPSQPAAAPSAPAPAPVPAPAPAEPTTSEAEFEPPAV